MDQYEFKDYMSKVVQLMTRMFERLKNEESESKRAPLVILVKAIGKFGPVFEYFNLLIKPLSEMLASPYSDDALKNAILIVLATRIAIDAMPDYYMVLSDSVINVITQTTSRNIPEAEQEFDLCGEAMKCLNNMKWAMIRAEQWETDYDEEVTARLKMSGYHECELRQWKSSDRPSQGFLSDFFIKPY